MKRSFYFLLLSSLAFGQGVVVPTQQALKVVNGTTSPVANATITVCAANTSGIPCSPVLGSAVFKDAALTQPQTNPFTSDANGNYFFAIAPGNYTVTVSAASFAGYSYQTTAPVVASANNTFTGTATFSGPANLNGGGSLTGTFSGPTSFSNTGTFTGSAMQEYLKSIVNSCNSLTEYQASAFGTGLFATNGISGCVAEPASSTTQAYGVAGFANTSTSGGVNANGVLGYGRALVNDSSAVGGQFGVTDVTNAGFATMELTGVESLVQATNGSANTVYQLLSGYGAIADFTNQPAKFWSGNSIQPIGNGYNCSTVGSNQWNNCLTSFDGATALFANIGTTSSASGASDSAPIQGSARASGTADTNAQIIFVHAAPSGACPALVTIAVNVAATSSTSADLYMCASGGSWNAYHPTEIGICTMASGTCTVTWSPAFAVAPLCNVQWNGTGTLTGIVKAVPSTTNCVVTSSVGTDTAVMQVLGTGAPN